MTADVELYRDPLPVPTTSEDERFILGPLRIRVVANNGRFILDAPIATSIHSANVAVTTEKVNE